MMREQEFKAWLEQRSAKTKAGRNTRTSAVRTIERKLDELGMPYQDLDEAWEADRFEALRERLRKMLKDARDGGQDYRILMPDAENPHNRLRNSVSWLGQYGEFLADNPPGTRNSDTDEAADESEPQENPMSISPVNLIGSCLAERFLSQIS